MSLAGNLRTMALPEILQWVQMGKKSGTLLLQRLSIEKRIVFRAGRIVSSWSNDPRESLGQILVREGLVSEEQLFKALLRQETEGPLIGAVLVSEGQLSEEALGSALRKKAEETIYDLFRWTEGRFEFREDEMPERVRFLTDISVTGVILEGVRRLDEWKRIREVFPSSRTTFSRGADAAQAKDAVEVQALKLASAGRSLAELAQELRLSLFDVAELLFDLHRRGLVAVAQPGAPLPEEDIVARVRALLDQARAQRGERAFEAAITSYETALGYDRLNQNAKKGLIEVIEERARRRTLAQVPLGKVPVLKMDFATLTRETFDAQEGFVLSRVTGEWDVQSILQQCPIPEDHALLIFARLLERGVIGFQ